ncbi:MAG TPA: hypothetical protein VIK61_01365 [Acidimicrobiia bacterium]
MPGATAYRTVPVLDEEGFVVLRPLSPPIPEAEWRDLEYLDWKSSGDTRFAPIVSALGELECSGFWDHGKADKDGMWTTNAARCPEIVRWVQRVGANFGRVRVIELQPQTYEDALRHIHVDDNNRLNPAGEGWVVRAFMQLTDDPDSFAVLRTDRDDPRTETRVPLPRGTQYVVDTERIWHVVAHNGDRPRYALIACFESGRPLERWIEQHRA